MKQSYMKWGIHFDLANKKLRIEEINKIMTEPDFWDDLDKAHKINKELTILKDRKSVV